MRATYPPGVTRTDESHRCYSVSWRNDSRTSVRCQAHSPSGQGDLLEDAIGGPTAAQPALIDGDPVDLHRDPEGGSGGDQPGDILGRPQAAEGEVGVEGAVFWRETGAIHRSVVRHGQRCQRLATTIGTDPQHGGPIGAGEGAKAAPAEPKP